MWPFSSSSSSSASASQPSPQAEAHTNFVDPSSSTTPQPQAAASSASSNAQQAEQSTTDYIQSHKFAQPSSSSFDSTYTPTASSLFSGAQFDAARLHPLAGLGKDEVEYLDIVDNQPNQLEGARTALPSRGWSDDLSYGTGTTYLSGLAIGGLLGAREGLGRPLGVDNPTMRLRLNAVLNQMTRRASFFGNSAGVIALIYNVTDAIIDNVRGKHDMAGAIAAGGISGAMFKATAGVRPMAVASGIMMGAAASWTAAKQALL
ncbi:Tim17-domain-containing protein [Jaminaea rosea]|uniref:Tim17-domain-containing protein n=1 Tax=Jaminaea rosea TaxID=1569628 RepID=A0A316V0H1_9BASI|nr:Tim17-domain-containing protein [Jaminaea rosea]PWN28935.1 Tim17-domain-containing protein [Jaminaea rosea]